MVVVFLAVVAVVEAFAVPPAAVEVISIELMVSGILMST